MWRCWAGSRVPPYSAAVARADTYNALVAGITLNVSDPAKGVIANDTNVLVFGLSLQPQPTER